MRNALAAEANIHGRISEANMNAAYWRRQQSLRTERKARAHAGALAAAWEQTRDRLMSTLPAVYPTPLP